MSKQRRCDYTKCSDGRWYLTLGDEEHAWELFDCTVYGPFESEEAVDEFKQLFSNPGGVHIDDSGTTPVPEKVVAPSPERQTGFGGRLWVL